MQSEPTVCAILLTRDRPAMAKRAVESFRRQTYARKVLLVLDTGSESTGYLGDYDDVIHHWADVSLQEWTIGELRNEANRRAGPAEVLCHWDSDDWSHPNRIAEQVALLQASGADAVGYSDLLFWKQNAGLMRLDGSVLRAARQGEQVGEAWLYSRPTRLNVPGTTLCYWRKTWERKPFPHLPEAGNPTSQGEDIVWQAGLKVEAVSSFCETAGVAPPHGPRMIASVHSGNTMAAGYSHMGHVEEFARTPEWDSYCERTMKL